MSDQLVSCEITPVWYVIREWCGRRIGHQIVRYHRLTLSTLTGSYYLYRNNGRSKNNYVQASFTISQVTSRTVNQDQVGSRAGADAVSVACVPRPAALLSALTKADLLVLVSFTF